MINQFFFYFSNRESTDDNNKKDSNQKSTNVYALNCIISIKKKSIFSKKSLIKEIVKEKKLLEALKSKFLKNKKSVWVSERYSNKRQLTTITKKILIVCTINLKKKDIKDIKSDHTSSSLFFFFKEFMHKKKLFLKLKI